MPQQVTQLDLMFNSIQRAIASHSQSLKSLDLQANGETVGSTAMQQILTFGIKENSVMAEVNESWKAKEPTVEMEKYFIKAATEIIDVYVDFSRDIEGVIDDTEIASNPEIVDLYNKMIKAEKEHLLSLSKIRLGLFFRGKEFLEALKDEIQETGNKLILADRDLGIAVTKEIEKMAQKQILIAKKASPSLLLPN